MFRVHYAYFHCTDQAGFRENAKATYLAHNELVKRVVPKDKLLLYRMGSGWEPLCRFLGKRVPGEEFPFENEGEVFQVEQRKTTEREALREARMIALWVAPVAVGVLAWYAYRVFGPMSW